MYLQTLPYEFSFASSCAKLRTKPAFVFTISVRHLDEIYRRLDILSERSRRHADAYCPLQNVFTQCSPDLFGRIQFGYGSCGFAVFEDTRVHLSIELGPGRHLYNCALTLKLLTHALAVPREGAPSNQPQQVEFQMRCDRSSDGYGHAVGGHVSSHLVSWLRAQASSTDVPLPSEVLDAMQEAWVAVSSRKYRRWASECCGRISPDGRFILECFGNACDIAIYPDQIHDEMDPSSPIPFGCHNLGGAHQQLTLLAGLAKLCELARRGEQS